MLRWNGTCTRRQEWIRGDVPGEGGYAVRIFMQFAAFHPSHSPAFSASTHLPTFPRIRHNFRIFLHFRPNLNAYFSLGSD